MIPAIAFDLTRLFVGPIIPTPRGIDRVDLGYSAHFLERWPGDCVATLPSPWGVRTLERGCALRLIRTVTAMWGETKAPGDDATYGFVKERLAGAQHTPVWPRRRVAAVKRVSGGLLRSFLNSGGIFGARAATAVPKGAVYLNTGQFCIASEALITWLRDRPDVKPIFMLHDTIPLDYPEYVAPVAKRLHARMIANTARYAKGLIVTTETVLSSVTREIARCGRSDLPAVAARLPVDQAFLGQEDSDPDLARRRYFVVCGTIEPRKNLFLLLDVWRRLVLEDGESAPKLVIVGTPWRRAEAVRKAIESTQSLRDSVVAVSGLTTPALRRLLNDACGLLMPSLAEGFGLPIIEALARRTPVIASDLPAHRETGGAYATYLDPTDEAGWLAAIRAHLNNRSAHRDRLVAYRDWTWTEYARCIEPFIETIWRERERTAGSRNRGPHEGISLCE